MVTQNQEFLMLHADDVNLLFSSDDLNVPNEETVYYALLAWAKHDIANRRKDLSRLLAQIRLPLLSPQVRVFCLVSMKEKPKIIPRRCWPIP